MEGEEAKEREIGDQNLAVMRPPFYVGSRTNTAPTGKGKRNKRIKAAVQEEKELSLREKAERDSYGGQKGAQNMSNIAQSHHMS